MKKILILSVLGFLLSGMISSASALTITPSTTPQLTGTYNWNPGADDIDDIVGYSGTLYEYYKQDVDDPEADLFFKDSYETTFDNGPSDPSDADIEYVGGWVIGGSPLYLLVKDGNHAPYWYIFDLLDIDGEAWDGMETLELRGFWPDGGAISHVAIYGGDVPVPEPATMLLLGTGLVGLAGFSRRKFRK